MRVQSPSSCGSLRIQVAVFDVFWATASPALALYLRDAHLIGSAQLLTSLSYSGMALLATLTCLIVFRVGDGLTPYFSLHDVGTVLKAVIAAEALTCLAFFTLTRLDGIPRSTPLTHAVILGAGLIFARLVGQRLLAGRAGLAGQSQVSNVLMIGSNQLTAIYIKMVQSCFRGRCRVVGVLDERSSLAGRAISGVHIVGHPRKLEQVVDEFKVHGIPVDRVLIGGDEGIVSADLLGEISDVCKGRGITLDFVAEMQGFGKLTDAIAKDRERQPVQLKAYHQIKRALDFTVALLAGIVTLPLSAIIAIIVFLDVGAPILFWQQRIGRGGRPFLLYKFRTLRLPIDVQGRVVPEHQRLSRVGDFLRRTRLDELPQLLNVLSGEMSLIGPRPLLPIDQPPDPTVRLSIRPGATGWAQINGGRELDAIEKSKYDEWYVHNASFWLDLRILLLTVGVFARGERQLARGQQTAKQRFKAGFSPGNTATRS